MTIEIAALEPSAPALDRLLDAWRALFVASECTCFCHYWHFEGTKNDWLMRCATSPETNAEEHAARVRANDPSARGLLAIERGEPGEDAPLNAVGWMKLAPRATLPKLTRQGAYRLVNLGDSEGVWSIGCLLVQPEHRGRRVAHALVAAAATQVRAWGGRAVEGYPHRAEYRLHPEEACRGPEALFRACGFVPVHDVGPYPVYRHDL